MKMIIGYGNVRNELFFGGRGFKIRKRTCKK